MKPNYVFEGLVKATYKEIPYPTCLLPIFYEYWCNIMDRLDQNWQWHADQDRGCFDVGSKLVFALVGEVYYGSKESYKGGDFQMVDAVPNKTNNSRRPTNPKDECGRDFFVNKLHLFLLYKNDVMCVKTMSYVTVCQCHPCSVHKVARLKSGTRYALAVNANYWLPYKVEQAPTNQVVIEIGKQSDRIHS